MRYLFNDCVVDTDRRELRRGDAAVSLEPMAFDVLTYLIRNRERVVSKDDLRTEVWAGRVVSESTVSSWMTAVRGAIGDNGENQRLIRTIPRRGFRFVGEVTEEPTPSARTNEEQPAKAPDEAHPAKDVLIRRSDRPSLFAIREKSDLAPIAHSGAFVGRLRMMLALALAAGVGAAITFVIVVPGRPALSPSPAGAPALPPLQKFDYTAVPLIENETRRSLATYPDRPNHKAVALATNGIALGVADSAPDVESAKAEAMQQCSKGGGNNEKVCRVYAIGMDVLWSKEFLAMPAPRDLRLEPLDLPLVADEIPTFSDATRKHIAERYVKPPGHKALAITTGQPWLLTRMSSREEAVRMVVERCSVGNMRPCLVLSVDGFLTIQLPKSRQVIGTFLPSTEVDISPPDRDRIATVYQGREWRALARGANGSWHAVADEPSEAAATNAALKSCSQTDRECRLYAIGNFRVAN